jgi:hypothetical protein
MNRKDLRVLLHMVGGVCWLIGLAQDVEEHRWRTVTVAIASHFVAEIVGGVIGEQFA